MDGLENDKSHLTTNKHAVDADMTIVLVTVITD